MHYLVLASDYDGTIAHDGHVEEATIAALELVRASGRRLVLVTGRELHELQGIFPPLALFDLVVAENGALLYFPATREVKLLAMAPPIDFVQRLRERGVAPMSLGHAIVATWEPHQTVVLETIRELNLNLQVIFNKDAVMILPAGVNKASGLQAALTLLGVAPQNVVGIGDAENDHPFLEICGCSAAVANALPIIKEHVHIVTRSSHGAGVAELIADLVGDDLQSRQTARAE